MDLYYKQEVSVGILVIAATVIFVVGLMFLSGVSVGGGGAVVVPVVFDNASGLDQGDAVYVSGLKVGRVKRIQMETVGRVIVELEVPKNMPPHADATAVVSALDFLGSMKVDYAPGTAAVLLNPDQVVIGSKGAGLADALPGLTDQAGDLLTGVTGILNEDMAANLTETMLALRRALGAFEQIAEGETVTDAQAALRTIQSAGARLDSIMANPSIGRSFEQLDEATASFATMTSDLKGATDALTDILGTVQNGNGTIALAMRDSTLHTDLHEVMTSMRLLLDDMRARPGRYFRLKVF